MYPVFDYTLICQLDAVSWLLDHESHRFIRWLLRRYKRTLESGVSR